MFKLFFIIKHVKFLKQWHISFLAHQRAAKASWIFD